MRVELLGGLMNLQKCFLENVFGTGTIAQKTDQKVIVLTLITGDKLSKGGTIPNLICPGWS